MTHPIKSKKMLKIKLEVKEYLIKKIDEAGGKKAYGRFMRNSESLKWCSLEE